MLDKLRKELRKVADPKKVEVYKRFFKTGKGEYGYGDVFLGITVPNTRKIAVQFRNLPFPDVKKLLQSKIHEERLLALLLLVHNFDKGDEETKEKIYNFYLANTNYINNWDLVDSSAHQIVGAYLFNRHSGLSRIDSGVAHVPQNDVLFKLAKSKTLWERRIAIIATQHFIRQGRFAETLQIAEMLLTDPHDLIHKAVGWMMREVGKKDQKVEEAFLKKHYRKMPRTMLRYAIERFPKPLMTAYLKGTI